MILPLDHIQSDLKQEVGEKAYGLWLLANQKLPTPSGFVITHEAFANFCQENELEVKLKSVFDMLDLNSPVQVLAALHKTRQIILRCRLPLELSNHLFQSYDRVIHDTGIKTVSLRISLGEASYDPHTDSDPLLLNISGENVLGESLKEIWAQALSTQVLTKFRHKLHQYKVAVLVHTMFESLVSGLLHTIDPSTGDKQSFLIEAIFGNGELLHKHHILSDKYLISKRDLTLLSQRTFPQEYQMELKGHVLSQTAIPYSQAIKPKLEKAALQKLLGYYRQLSKVSVLPSTIEWSYDGKQFQFFQLQHLSDYQERFVDPQIEAEQKLPLPILSRGNGIQPGIAHGQLMHFDSNERYSEANIVMVDSIDTDEFKKLKKVSGLISCSPQTTEMLKLFAKDHGIVLIDIHSQQNQMLQQGMIVTLDGLTGYVYSGFLTGSQNGYSRTLQPPTTNAIDQLRTNMHLYINPMELHFFKQNYDPKLVDGLLYFEGEQILSATGENPWDVLALRGKSQLTKLLQDYLTRACNDFVQKPVFYKCSDFKTSTLNMLSRTSTCEPHDHNPTIGNRGMLRHLHNGSVLELELATMAKIWSQNPALSVVVPYFRTITELHFFHKLWQLTFPDDKKPQLWLSINTPANIINLPQYLEFGYNGYILDWTNVCKLSTGIDPQNPKLANYLDSHDPAVYWLLKRLQSYAKENKQSVALVRVPEPLSEHSINLLQKYKIDGLAVSWENYLSTKLFVAKLEKRERSAEQNDSA